VQSAPFLLKAFSLVCDLYCASKKGFEVVWRECLLLIRLFNARPPHDIPYAVGESKLANALANRQANSYTENQSAESASTRSRKDRHMQSTNLRQIKAAIWDQAFIGSARVTCPMGSVVAVRRRKGQLLVLIHGWGHWHPVESISIERLGCRLLL